MHTEFYKLNTDRLRLKVKIYHYNNFSKMDIWLNVIQRSWAAHSMAGEPKNRCDGTVPMVCKYNVTK